MHSGMVALCSHWCSVLTDLRRASSCGNLRCNFELDRCVGDLDVTATSLVLSEPEAHTQTEASEREKSESRETQAIPAMTAHCTSAVRRGR